MRLNNIREEIDKVDTEIVKLLSKRQSLVLKVAKIKHSQKLPLTHTKREEEILSRMKKIAKKLHIHDQFIQKIYKLIFTESKKVQREILSSFKR